MEPSNWNAHLYDTNHGFVSKYGASLITLLAPNQGEKVLDLGCGTGDLTKELSEANVDVIGVDKSPNMINQAIDKYPHLQFHIQDATELAYKDEFDAVFSNAALHWIKSPQKALENIYASLKQGGRFVAEFGGKENVTILTNELIRQIRMAGFSFDETQFPWYFPSIADYTYLMEKVGFRVTFARHYDRPTKLAGADGLSNWLHMFAKDFFTHIPEDARKKMITNMENELKDYIYREGNWIADYKRIQVVGIT